jgi:hypothetical protein
MMFPAIALPALLVGSLSAAPSAPVADFFSPRPGSEVKVADADIARLATGAKTGQLRGFIDVSPPPGHCLAVFRGDTGGAEQVCKKTSLSFRLSDIDRAGRIRWEVKASALDPETTLTWPTPYRLAMFIARERGKVHAKADSEEYWRGLPPSYAYIRSCNDISEPGHRKLEVKLFTGESWRFIFPDKHQLLPQPFENPNLFISGGFQKRGLPEGGKKAEGPAEAEAAPQPAPEEKKPEESTASDPAKAAGKKEEKPNNWEDRKSWTIPLRDSYVMSTDNFHPDNSQTPGTRGLCRYNFSGTAEDPGTGRMECLDTPYFHMLLLPMTCLNRVKGDRDQTSNL